MNVVVSQDEEALRTELRQARERVDALVQDLRTVDGELEDLSTDRQRYRLLGDACGALEELRELGAAALFWGEGRDGAEQLGLARSRAAAFEKRLGQTESRRGEIVVNGT